MDLTIINLKTINDLKPGCSFIYEGDHYLVTDDEGLLNTKVCLNLNTLCTKFIGLSELVHETSISITIK